MSLEMTNHFGIKKRCSKINKFTKIIHFRFDITWNNRP